MKKLLRLLTTFWQILLGQLSVTAPEEFLIQKISPDYNLNKYFASSFTNCAQSNSAKSVSIRKVFAAMRTVSASQHSAYERAKSACMIHCLSCESYTKESKTSCTCCLCAAIAARRSTAFSRRSATSRIGAYSASANVISLHTARTRDRT